MEEIILLFVVDEVVVILYVKLGMVYDWVVKGILLYICILVGRC